MIMASHAHRTPSPSRRYASSRKRPNPSLTGSWCAPSTETSVYSMILPMSVAPSISCWPGAGCHRDRCRLVAELGGADVVTCMPVSVFSSGDLADLKNGDGFGDLACAPGAEAEFTQDAPVFELGVGALAGAAQFRVGGVCGFLGGRLVPGPVRGEDVPASAGVALVGQHD